MKTFSSLAAVLLLCVVACREKPIDQGALITARTVGLEHLQRGRLREAEQARNRYTNEVQKVQVSLEAEIRRILSVRTA